MEKNWNGGCNKLKYVSLMTCSLVPAYLVIKEDEYIAAIIVYLTIFFCLWPRILWWMRNDFLDFSQKHFPELHLKIEPKILSMLEWMFGK